MAPAQQLQPSQVLFADLFLVQQQQVRRDAVVEYIRYARQQRDAVGRAALAQQAGEALELDFILRDDDDIHVVLPCKGAQLIWKPRLSACMTTTEAGTAIFKKPNRLTIGV